MQILWAFPVYLIPFLKLLGGAILAPDAPGPALLPRIWDSLDSFLLLFSSAHPSALAHCLCHHQSGHFSAAHPGTEFFLS